MIARYKRPGGFKILVHQLESVGPKRRASMIAALRREDPAFMDAVEKSILTFSELTQLPDPILCEILFAMEPEIKTVAIALYHMPSNVQAPFLRNMLPALRKQFDDETVLIVQLREFERQAAQMRIVAKGREIEPLLHQPLKPYILED